MTIERIIGRKQIAERLAEEIEQRYPLSRHVFPDSSFLLFGPSDCDGVKVKPTKKRLFFGNGQ